jgi:hypothetical protein
MHCFVSAHVFVYLCLFNDAFSVTDFLASNETLRTE